MVERWLRSPVFRFLLVGGANTAATAAIVVLLSLVLPGWLAFTIAYALGLAFTTVVSGRWVFSSHLTVWRVTLFVGAYLGIYLVGLGFVSLVTTWGAPSWVNGLSVVVTAPLSFVAGRLIFHNRRAYGTRRPMSRLDDRNVLVTPPAVRNEEIAFVSGPGNPGVPRVESPTIPWRTWAPVFAFVFALVMAYGYEVFSFHLTLDEEIFGEASNTGYARTWLEQGRWSMAILTLLIPSPVVPVVSTILGVSLTGLAYWILCRRYLNMRPWLTALLAGSAATLPTLSFMFSFATIAYGIGIGNMLLVAYFAWLLSPRWRMRALGVVALAFSAGIYDSFLVAGAALSLALIMKRPQWSTAVIAPSSVVIAYVLSRAMAFASQKILHITPDSYTAKFIDTAGLLKDPIGRATDALARVGEVLFLSSKRFSLHTPWLMIVIGILVILAVLTVVRVLGTRAKVIGLVALLLLLAIPFAVEAAAPFPTMLRAMIYLPICMLVLAGVACGWIESRPASARYVTFGLVAAVTVLAIIGQAAISNRLFAASETAYAQDQNLAFVIGMEKERLVGSQENVPVVFGGTHRWSESALLPDRETLGTSFFAGRGGERSLQYRNAAFLRSQGVAVRMAAESEAAGALKTLQKMPRYPQPGWIAFEKGVLLVNFGVEDGQ